MDLQGIPICVDLDATLTPTDLLYESLLTIFRYRPWRIFLVLCWLFKGSAILKAKLSTEAPLDWRYLPINQDVISLLRHAHTLGRKVFLVTTSDIGIASAFSNHLGVFDEVISSKEGCNLNRKKKISILSSRFGQRGYDYIGGKSVDLPVWENSRKAIVVTSSKRLIRRAEKVTEVEQVIPIAARRAMEYLRMLRIHQWLKNLLVFVPGLAAHRMAEADVFLSSVLAFVAFGLCASSVYIFNDLLDLESDRQHRTKCKRLLASGRIPIYQGAAFAPVLLLAGYSIAATLPNLFFQVLVGYFAVTLLYSMLLKKQVIVDVLTLAGLYTVRVIAGAAVTGIRPSFWLLAFSIFIFFSLAIAKRYAELSIAFRQNKVRPAGRGYVVDDLPVLLALGVASGFVAVLVMALYINNPELQMTYPSPIWLWLVPGLLLYWVSRLWMKTHRGEMHEDPVIFAARDWQSLSVVVIMAICFLLAMKTPVVWASRLSNVF